MTKSLRFDPNGDFSLNIHQYLLNKAKEGIELGVNGSEADYSWQTFFKECESLAKAIAHKHPGGQSDSFRLARTNFHRQASRFVNWLANGRGKLYLSRC